MKPSLLHPPLDPSKFATSKYTWQDLKEIISNNRFPIYRHVDQETTYRLYTQQLKKEWKSVYDFVLYCKFEYSKRLIPIVGDDDADVRVGVSVVGLGGNNNNNENETTTDEKTNNNYYPTLPNIPSPPNGYLWESYPPPEKVNQKQRILAKNDFPYYMEDGIEHWCLWKLGGDDVDETDIKWGMRELNSQCDDIEMLHWINPEHLKSLPGIDHAHIVCWKKK